MEVRQLVMKGILLGASEVKNYETGEPTGQLQLSIGARNHNGVFSQTNIKTDVVNVADFNDLFDKQVEIVFEDVSINVYQINKRIGLSVKAKTAFIEQL